MLRTVGLEGFGQELGEALEEIDRLEEHKQRYIQTVDSYKRGDVSPEQMKSAVYDMARSIDDLQQEILDAEMIYRRAVGGFETSGSEVPDRLRGVNEEMAEGILEQGFEIVTSPSRSKYAESATENELAYQSLVDTYGIPDFIDEELTRGEQLKQIVDNARENFDRIEEEATRHQHRFLYENLGKTVSGAYLDIQDGHVEAALEQEIEGKKAEEVRRNPRDSYIGGFRSDNGIENLDEARKAVRDGVPRGKLENEGPSKEEVEKNNKRIEEKREEVRKREDRGIH